MTTPSQDAAHLYDHAEEQLIDAEADSVPQPQPPIGTSATGRFVLGASLVLSRVNIDYAHQTRTTLGDYVHRFGVRFTL